MNPCLRKLALGSYIITCVLNFTSARAGFDDWRADVNFAYSNLLQGKCEENEQVTCHDDHVLGPEAKSLSKDVKTINMRSAEDEFFANARAEQSDYLKCDIEQLKAMKKGDEKSIEFQKQVLTDLSEKLPELRVLYKKSLQLKAERDELNSQEFNITISMGKGYIAESEARKKIAEIKVKADKANQVYQKEAAKYNVLFSSVWRADDPIMQKYIMRQIVSNRAPEDLLAEALVYKKDSIFIRKFTDVTFSFQSQVLDPIQMKAKEDLDILQKKGDLDFSTKKMLVSHSEWTNQFSDEKPDLQSAQLMCVLDKRYVSGDEAVKTTGEILSIGAGGLGLAAKLFTATKYARLMSAGATRAALVSSNVLSTASLYLGAPLVATQVKTACFEDKPDHAYRGPKTCSSSNIEKFSQLEKLRVEQDNCVVAVAMAGLLTSPLTIKYIDKYKKAKANPIFSQAYLRAQATATKKTSLESLALRLSPTLKNDPKIKEILALRVNEKNAGDIKFLLEKSKGSIDSPAKLNAVLDELSSLSIYTQDQKDKILKGLIATVDRDASKGLTVVQKLKQPVIAFRENQFNRDVSKLEKEVKLAQPQLSNEAVKKKAFADAITRRENRIMIQKSCSSLSSNPTSVQAATKYAQWNTGMSIVLTTGAYFNAHLDEVGVKDLGWTKRLSYELGMAIFSAKWGSKIVSKQSSGFAGKIAEGHVAAGTIASIDAAAYGAFFSGGGDKAKEELEKITSSAEFKKDLKTLEDFIRNKNDFEDLSDDVGDFSKNIVRWMTGKNKVDDITVEEIRKLDPETLKDPIVMERMMDTIEDQLYSQELHGKTLGNKSLDRLAFDLNWNIEAVPRGVILGMLTYQVVCRNMADPKLAVGGFLAIQGANKSISGDRYFKAKAKEINQ